MDNYTVLSQSQNHKLKQTRNRKVKVAMRNNRTCGNMSYFSQMFEYFHNSYGSKERVFSTPFLKLIVDIHVGWQNDN